MTEQAGVARSETYQLIHRKPFDIQIGVPFTIQRDINLDPTRDIIDATIHDPEIYSTQMLDYSRFRDKDELKKPSERIGGYVKILFGGENKPENAGLYSLGFGLELPRYETDLESYPFMVVENDRELYVVKMGFGDDNSSSEGHITLIEEEWLSQIPLSQKPSFGHEEIPWIKYTLHTADLDKYLEKFLSGFS